MEGDFWQRCIDAGCVIVPVRMYSDWGDDGNEDESKRIGLRFAAMEYGDPIAVVSSGAWVMIDAEVAGAERYHDTPEAALAAWEAGWIAQKS